MFHWIWIEMEKYHLLHKVSKSRPDFLLHLIVVEFNALSHPHKPQADLPFCSADIPTGLHELDPVSPLTPDACYVGGKESSILFLITMAQIDLTWTLPVFQVQQDLQASSLAFWTNMLADK